jgi:hypothetical protein
MKNLILLCSILFFNFNSFSQSRSEGSFKIGNIEVSRHKFTEYVDFATAKRLVTKLGKGWRLPTKDELNDIYEYNYLSHDFEREPTYWSSTKKGTYNIWVQEFAFGSKLNGWDNNEFLVIAVKTITH